MKVVMANGLVRNSELFIEFLDNISGYIGPNDKIIFSTWNGHMNNHNDVFEKLKQYKAIIIESHEPLLMSPGHTYHQCVSLGAALDVIPDHAAVFKTRPDFPETDLAKRFMLGEYDSYIGNDDSNTKIGIHSAMIASPMYINDMTFLGRCRNLKNIASMRIRNEHRFANLAPEQLLWASSIDGLLKNTESFLRVSPQIPFGDKQKAYDISKILTKNQTYIRSIAEYIWFLSEKVFFLQDKKSDIYIDEKSIKFSLEDILWADDNIRGCRPHPSAYQNIVMSSSLIEIVKNNRFASSLFGDMVSMSIKNDIMIPYEQSDILKIESDTDMLAQELVSKMLGTNYKSYDIKDGDLKQRQGGERWKMLQGDMNTVRNLESQNNVLQRKINTLEAEIFSMKKSIS